MAINKNIGRISAALEEGRKAASKVSFGPSVGNNMKISDSTVGDWSLGNFKSEAFIFVTNYWGSSKNRQKVGK